MQKKNKKSANWFLQGNMVEFLFKHAFGSFDLKKNRVIFTKD